MYGILVSPIIVSEDLQQVIQYIKRKDKIEEVNFGGVRFQELYYSEIEYKRQKLEKIQVKRQAFTETLANLPDVQVVDLDFNSNFDQKDQQLDITEPSYRLYCKVKNNTSNNIPIQIKLEMPSLNKENLPVNINLGGNQEISESIIISKPDHEGKHDFNIIVCDKENFRLAKAESYVKISRSKKRKILDFTLVILKLSS